MSDTKKGRLSAETAIELSDNFKETMMLILQALDMSQAELAQKTDNNNSWLSQVFGAGDRKIKRPSAEKIIKITDFLRQELEQYEGEDKIHLQILLQEEAEAYVPILERINVTLVSDMVHASNLLEEILKRCGPLNNARVKSMISVLLCAIENETTNHCSIEVSEDLVTDIRKASELLEVLNSYHLGKNRKKKVLTFLLMILNGKTDTDEPTAAVNKMEEEVIKI